MTFEKQAKVKINLKTKGSVLSASLVSKKLPLSKQKPSPPTQQNKHRKKEKETNREKTLW